MESIDSVDSVFPIVTPRLRLHAPSLGELAALLRDQRRTLEARIQATLPRDWPGPHLTAALPDIAAAMAQEPGDARWVWMVIERGTACVIGDIGYHGPLRADATVEIGFVLLPHAHGRGYATEATAALLRWTFAQTVVAEIIAQIDPQNVASLRVAAKAGMQARPPVSPRYRCFGVLRTSTQTSSERSG